MIIGACAGSTTGGMKCIRVVILFKVAQNEFKHILHPNAVLPVRVNKQVISPSIQSTVLAFTFLYAVIAIISVLIMMGLGVGFLESIGTVISSMGNMGPGLGTCGPAFSWSALPDAAKWLLSFLMLLGRLELFTVLLLFTSDFGKKIKHETNSYSKASMGSISFFYLVNHVPAAYQLQHKQGQ